MIVPTPGGQFSKTDRQMKQQHIAFYTMIVVCIGYLLVAFLNMEINAANWPIKDRAAWVFLCTMATGIALVGFLFNHVTKDT